MLSLEETPDLDGTSIEALVDFAAEQARARVTLVLARLKDPVLALLQSSLSDPTETLLEPGSVDDAVARLSAALAGKEPQASPSSE